MKKILGVLMMALLFGGGAPGKAAAKGKILYLDSYHEGYAWSDGLTRGIRSVLYGQDVELKIFRMDSKRQTRKKLIRQKAMEAKMLIDSYEPDVVIGSDDNVAKYLIKPFYRDANLPFVFCGINWDVSAYGFPYRNVTGMIEVSLFAQLLEHLRAYGQGTAMAYLAADVMTARKEGLYYRKLFHVELDEFYVNTFADWKTRYQEIQERYDLLIVGNSSGIEQWNDSEAEQFVLAQTRIPSGALYDFMAPYALISYVKVAEEQGQWAAKTALKVLRGTDIASIPIVKNRQGKLVLNEKLAQMLTLDFGEKLIQAADLVLK